MEKLKELLLQFCPPILLACWFDINYLFGGLFTLIFIDNITAIYQAYKFRSVKKKWFNYKKLKTTGEKFLMYGLIIIVAWILQKIFNKDFGLTNIMTGYLAVIEAYSISRHVGIILNMNIFVFIMDNIIEKTGFKFNKNKDYEQKNIKNKSNK